MLKEFRYRLANWIAPEPVERVIPVYLEKHVDVPRYTVVSKDVEHHRLNQEQYAALEKEVLVGFVPKTSEEALVMTGIEHVLRKLRKGWVIGQ